MARQADFKLRKSPRTVRFFSESFKKLKVGEIERNLTTVCVISREYEVSRSAVYQWIYKYSFLRQKQVRQIIEPMSDAKKIQELRNKIQELERLVGQKQIQLEFKDKMIEIAEEMYSID